MSKRPSPVPPGAGPRRKKPKIANVSEADVGITRRMHSGGDLITAQLKVRYTDFMVNEIDLDGNVVHLTELTVRDEFKLPVLEQEKVDEILSSILEEAKLAEVQELLEKARNYKGQQDQKAALKNAVKVDVTDWDKAKRTKLHSCVKQFSLISSTVDEKDGDVAKKYIVIRHKTTCTNDRSVFRDSFDWNKGEYCHFTLCKINFDTSSALSLLASKLKTSAKLFNISGTKDKRGVTTQRVSAKKTRAEKLAQANSQLPRHIRIGNFEYKKDRLELGKLKGNRFHIVLRNVPDEDEVCHRALQGFKEKGFINYFGLQRFGTTSIPTYKVGICILQKDYAEALNLIFRSKAELCDMFIPAADLYTSTLTMTNNEEKIAKISEAIALTPRFCRVELAMLDLLKVSGMNHLNCILRIPRQLRTMYIHAVQSFVWNEATSLRMAAYGNAVVEGDIVLAPDAVKEEVEASGVGEAEEDEDGEADDDDDDDDAAAGPGKKGIPLPKVLMVTADNKHKFTVFDVVMTSPGPCKGISYPTHTVGRSVYEELLAKVGAGALIHDEELIQKSNFLLYGGYRKVCTSPTDVEWSIKRHGHIGDDLWTSDIDKLAAAPDPVLKEDGALKSIAVAFSLPSSAYATMAIREFCRVVAGPAAPGDDAAP